MDYLQIFLKCQEVWTPEMGDFVVGWWVGTPVKCAGEFDLNHNRLKLREKETV